MSEQGADFVHQPKSISFLLVFLHRVQLDYFLKLNLEEIEEGHVNKGKSSGDISYLDEDRSI